MLIHARHQRHQRQNWIRNVAPTWDCRLSHAGFQGLCPPSPSSSVRVIGIHGLEQKYSAAQHICFVASYPWQWFWNAERYLNKYSHSLWQLPEYLAVTAWWMCTICDENWTLNGCMVRCTRSPEVLAIGTGTATVLAFFLGLSSEPEFLISVVVEALTPTFSRFWAPSSLSKFPGVNPTCYINSL